MDRSKKPEELEINARVLVDEEFRQALLKRPAETLAREYGVTVPEGVRIEVHEETEEVVHLVVPGRPHRWEGLLRDRELTDSILQRLREGRTDCCTCGASTAQTMSSLQTGCGCA